MQEGETLLNHAKSIKLIEYLPYINAYKIMKERLQDYERTDFLLNHMLIYINGDDFVNSATVKDRQSDEEKILYISGVFVYIEFLLNSEFLQNVVELDSSGYVITNENIETSVTGIYAVDDVMSKKVRLIDVSC